MKDGALFGPGGNSESFYAEGFKHSAQAPGWVAARGLDAYEYQAGNGLTAGPDALRRVGEAAAAAGIRMSLHAPYFISLSGIDETKRLGSLNYIRKSAEAAALLGADTIVIHTGSAAKITREQALALARDTLEKVCEAIPANGIQFGLETMGKKNQLGTLEEVLTLCAVDARYVPVVDFGHLNARNEGGAFPDADSYRRVFDAVALACGDDVARHLHCHFSMIEYTAAGEKKHRTFADGGAFGPAFEPLGEAIAREGLAPRVICESAGTMAEDALCMKKIYTEALTKWK